MNITINSENNRNKDNLRKTVNAAIWWTKTLFNAFMLPYYAVGAVFAFSFLMGVSFIEVRETVVTFAGLEFRAWDELGGYWKTASLSISAIYVAYQVIFSQPVTVFFNELFSPILTKVDLFLKSKKGIFIFPLSIMLIALFVFSFNSHEHKSTSELMLTKQYSPYATASITLPSGKILSGGATVTKQQNSYIVRFNN